MAISPGFRQEVFNVELARLLSARGVEVSPEDVQALGKKRKMPDVLFDFNGLRGAVECEVDDQPNATKKALDSAAERVESGLTQIAVALVYPAALRTVDFKKLGDHLERAQLSFAVVTEAGAGGWLTGNVDDLSDTLRHVFDQLVREDVVAKAVAKLEVGIDRFAAVVGAQQGTAARLAQALGIPDKTLKPAQVKEATRVGGLVLLNALIFQEVLSEHNGEVKPLNLTAKDAENPLRAFSEHWKFVLETINYYSIFHVAREVLSTLPASAEVRDTLDQMIDIACDIVSMRAPLRHDLMGRVFHRLLASAKNLGTYYTSIPAATLLARLALRGEDQKPWHEMPTLAGYRIADPSCGTGTLLMAAADGVLNLSIRMHGKNALEPDLTEMHRLLTEEVLHGYDVLPSAIHLTASTLSLRAPQIAFKKTRLFNLPLGGLLHRLGSIEFMESHAVDQSINLFSVEHDVQEASGKGPKNVAKATMPQLDLCIMNPPFVRSVGGNLLFGSLPEAERAEMQKKLARILTRQKALASSTAGLGAVFVAIGHRFLKSGGKMALVLPKALLSGVAWNKTR